jgi:hypothetical protein
VKSLLQFIAEASIRQGLPHITTMDHHQFGNLVGTGKVHLHSTTEKTDGMTHVMGHDEHGFYTQGSNSGSEKMRSGKDFHRRAQRREKETGNPHDPRVPTAFAHVHDMMAKNKGVKKHLSDEYKKSGKDAKIRGEVFYKPFGNQGDHPHETKFVGTSYDTRHMGEHGKYVIHSKLPENHHVDTEKFKKHSTHEMNFDDDKIHKDMGHVDVSHEHAKFMKLDHGLLGSRTKPSNKAAKTAELEKLHGLKHAVSSKVDSHIKKHDISPKWGSGSEGIVVHPTVKNLNAPRFKVTSDNFRKFKAEQK